MSSVRAHFEHLLIAACNLADIAFEYLLVVVHMVQVEVFWLHFVSE